MGSRYAGKSAHKLSAQQDQAGPFRGGHSTAQGLARPLPLSSIALAVALLAASPQQARAANECGAEAAGADSITCSGTSYPAGIQYTGSDGLTLNLNNPGMVVQANAGGGAVSIQGAVGNMNNLVVNATSLTSITGVGVGRSAISIVNPGEGLGIITMDSGFATNTGSGNTLSVTNASGSGDVQITLNGGRVSNAGTQFGAAAMLATTSGTATGNATITMTGGTVESLGNSTLVGLRAFVNSASSSGAATINLSSGSVTASSLGLQSLNNGLGEAVITMTGGTVTTTTGIVSASGLYANVNNAASSANARVAMQGGSVTTRGTTAHGIWGQNRGTGQAIVDMSGGTVSAPSNNADGILAQSTGGSYAVNVTGGTVSGGAGNGAGIRTAAAAGGTLNIGAGAVINAGASGIAIRDGDANHDGIDETGGNAVITTAGTLNGNVLLGGGTDSLTITGGAINGNITGNGPDTLAFDLGAGSFSYGAANTISGIESVTMRSGTAQIDSAITGTTAVNVNGGKLVLTAANTYTGATTVAGGILQLGTSGAPASIAGNVDVLAAGRLQGTGSVGNLTVAGTIAPGHSIGTLNVNGNYTQAAGSTYLVEVDPASNASDLIHATGSASIASGANLSVLRTANSGYVIGNRYKVLTADGGITGIYSLTGDTRSAFAQLVASYDANNVYLDAQQVRSFTSVAGSPNQVAVAAALQSLPEDNGLLNAVAWLPSDFAARDAFNQLSVDIHASTKTALLEDSRFVQEAAIDRLRTASCAPGSAAQAQQQPSPQPAGSACTPEGPQRAAWSQVFGSWGSIDGNGNAAKLKRDIGGFVVGADTGIGAGWRVGGLAGYSRASADTDARNSSAKTDSYHLGVYGGTQWGATALRLGANHSWNKTETSRSVAFAGFADSLSADYDSSTTQLFGEAGHRIDAGRVALEPFARLAYVRLHSDAFVERGGLAALYGEGGSIDATFTTLGLRASTQLGERTRLRGMLGWRHAFGDTTPTSTHAFAGSIPFTLEGVPLAKNVAVVEAGVETQLRPNLSLGASYSGQFGNGLEDHGFKVNLNWAF
ncbi:autotransporter domain-containing protein [Variovorax paradoxus]|nr:autotransporter domain-containing protein [Variovorax paradoxus]MBT2303802.1 autotransporter domain-containing protein [Variovorax paradoxus]